MKVTAILPDNLVNEVKRYSRGANITDSLQIALRSWLKQQKIKHLNEQLTSKPLIFRDGFTASKVRAANRIK